MAPDDEWADFEIDDDVVEKNDSAECLSEVKSSSSMSSFDMCDDFDCVKQSVCAESISSKGGSSDFDFCEEFDDVESSSSDETLISIAESSSSGGFLDFSEGERNLSADLFTSLAQSSTEFEEMVMRGILKEHTLPLLPAKALIRFKSVSKDWEKWITSPFLVHKQSYRFNDMSGYFYQDNNNNLSFTSLCEPAYGVPLPSLSFLPQAVSIKSSCKGLLLCQTLDGDNTYYICNPATEQWKTLPPPHYYHGEDPAIVLAFEPSVLNMEAHYQIVCAFPVPDQQILCFEIYSSETNSWEVSEELCVELEGASLRNNGFYFNGTAYWETTSGEVLAFDLKNEIHGVVALPCKRAPGGVIAQIKGELSYIRARRFVDSVFKVDIYGGMNMDSKRSVSFDVGTNFGSNGWVMPCILPFMDEDIVMISAGGIIYSCSFKHKAVEVVNMDGGLYMGGKYFPYVNSLVSVA